MKPTTKSSSAHSSVHFEYHQCTWQYCYSLLLPLICAFDWISKCEDWRLPTDLQPKKAWCWVQISFVLRATVLFFESIYFKKCRKCIFDYEVISCKTGLEVMDIIRLYFVWWLVIVSSSSFLSFPRCVIPLRMLCEHQNLIKNVFFWFSQLARAN